MAASIIAWFPYLSACPCSCYLSRWLPLILKRVPKRALLGYFDKDWPDRQLYHLMINSAL
jgi:hypothetical protein